MNLHGKKIFITGGTGFLGGRLVEKLILEYKAKVRVLVRNFTTASRLARFNLEIIQGDLCNIDDLRRCVAGCDIIFHCAYGNTGSPKQRKAVTVTGTEALAKAALEEKIAKMIHVSTISVYGNTLDGDLDETAPRRRSGDLYADTKLAAEQLLFDYYKKYGLPVSIIQPTIVYGPFAGAWTIWPIKKLKTSRVVLIDGGKGFCNAVYVDDVIDAMLLAAIKDDAIGQSFLISGKSPVTWEEFYGGYEKILGFRSTVDMSFAELRAYTKREKKENSKIQQIRRIIRNRPSSRILQLLALEKPYRLVRFVLPKPLWEIAKLAFLGDNKEKCPSAYHNIKPIHLPNGDHIALFKSKTRVRIDKASQYLGYQPQFDFEQGMAITAKWAKWANLL